MSRSERRTIEIVVHQDRAGRVGGRPGEDGSPVVGRLFQVADQPLLEVRNETDGTVEVQLPDSAFKEFAAQKREAITRVYQTLESFPAELKAFFPQVPQVLPGVLEGQLVNLDGRPADTVSVEARRPTYLPKEKVDEDQVRWPTPRTLTDFRGAFSLKLPPVPVPAAGIELQISGANTTEVVKVSGVDLEDGKLGVVMLRTTLTPLERSIVAELKDVIPASANAVAERPDDFATPAPGLRFGEGDCARAFSSNAGVVDRFGYSMLIRLVEPQVSPRHLVLRARDDDGNFTPLLADTGVTKEQVEQYREMGTWHYTDRVPIDRPLDVTAFRSTLERQAAVVPKAGTLGLGYVVSMHQTWIPAGLSLGDLLYSMALAPGEQQRIAIHERSETLSVRDAESLSADEQQRMSEAADSSTLAVFNSSLREVAFGGSTMATSSSSFNLAHTGGAAGLAGSWLISGGSAAGYGSSSSSGATSSWQQGSRDFVSSASQSMHSQLARQAAAARRSSRTAVRLATATEAEQVTTKVIANHNHCHALTLQYWEVLRHYGVSSTVDDVQLVCFVPLELVEFRDPAEAAEVPTTRSGLLARYRMLLQYHDVLSRAVGQPAYGRGLTALQTFAADPTMTAQSATQATADKVSFSLTGTFLPFEELSVTLVTRSGGRVGPLRLAGPVAAIPSDTYTTTGELLQYLRERRSSTAGATLSAELVLPTWIARSEVARFEVSRRTQQLDHRLRFDISALPAGDAVALTRYLQSRAVRFSPADLERELGGPLVWDIKAQLDSNSTYVNAATGSAGARQMPALLQLPANRVGRVLTFDDILLIEAAYQHICQNSVTYSTAVWASLTPEERVILLEPFTIGVPQGGVADPSQEVPLLNCVANQMLGFYGNCMVMPFHIPPALAKRMEVTSRDVQEALVRFHRQAFSPPRSSITLPTNGMLGEAVLGGCNSCEKIDLTRFWNWQDSQGDAVDQITPSELTAGSQGLVGAQGAQGPDKLTSPTSLINIGTGQATTPSTELVASLVGHTPQPFGDLTGRTDLGTQVSAERTGAAAARTEALTLAKEVQLKILEAFTKIQEKEADARKEEAKNQSEQRAKDDKQAADTRKAKIDALGATPTYFINQVAAVEEPKMKAQADKVLLEHFKGPIPDKSELLGIYDKFQETDKDSDNIKKAKKALIAALGLGS